MEKKYYGVSDTAEYLSLSKPTLYRLVESRKIPFIKLGKLVRFDIKEVEQWLNVFRKKALT
ncbi:hypothetical protein A2223_00060 [Candidatus Falkowbacteria bacterium RIFOXYA2_FULL_35_8]|nr:MAG: hypothetical protein A2223_00060 [Candidatus Falkowbacteria bacterium RIFOXYA2_FULL_35_8]